MDAGAMLEAPVSAPALMDTQPGGALLAGGAEGLPLPLPLAQQRQQQHEEEVPQHQQHVSLEEAVMSAQQRLVSGVHQPSQQQQQQLGDPHGPRVGAVEQQQQLGDQQQQQLGDDDQQQQQQQLEPMVVLPDSVTVVAMDATAGMGAAGLEGGLDPNSYYTCGRCQLDRPIAEFLVSDDPAQPLYRCGAQLGSRGGGG